jgi:UDP-2,3-diacylglucosamine hydrolase
MHTIFISDLHLEDTREESTDLLVELLQGPARQADALYILGDLFEFWIGDDVLTKTAHTVATELAALSKSGTPCFCLHGNRDFLIGSQYAQLAGFQLLPETNVIDFYGTPTLLLHGDTLCTDDHEYQAFRRQVRDPQFQGMFLAMSHEQRLAMAKNARDASREHMGEISAEIMDVNEAAVCAAFVENDVELMIHGHTHRPAANEHKLPNGRLGKRLVLADWYKTGSYLRLDAQGFETINLPDPG